MKFFGQLFLVSLLSFIFSCETSNETSTGKNSEASSEGIESSETPNATILYSGGGQIGTYPVIWEVISTEDMVSGSYQYEGQEASLSLSGEYVDGKASITESDGNGKKTGRLELENFPDPIWRGTWSNRNDEQLAIAWTAEKATIRSSVEGWPTSGLSLTAKEVSLYTPDSLCHVIHKIWRADGNAPIARAFNAVTQPPSFQDRKVGITDCMIALEDMESMEDFPPSGEESTVRLGTLMGNILPVHFDYYSYYAGAAHGNYGSRTTHLLLPTLQEIEPDDIFTEGYQTELSRLVQEGLEEQFGVDTGLEYKGLPDEFNYELQSNHLIVYFNPYEIGPYVLGKIKVAIPYDQIHGMIREDGPLGK